MRVGQPLPRSEVNARMSEPAIHPTALVDREARLGRGVTIGAWSVIGPEVELGDGTAVAHHTTIVGRTRIGTSNIISPYVSIGLPPQHLHDDGSEARIEIGDRNTIREFVTIHLATVQGGALTRIGNDNFLMNYVHVAHDCLLGNNIILANSVQLGGHTAVGDRANLGGQVALHQFVKVGTFAMCGGASALRHDVPPYTMVEGNPARLRGLNLTGLKRAGFDAGTVSTLKKAYRILFRSGLTVEKATGEVTAEFPGVDAVANLVSFMRASNRGVCR